MKDGSGEDDVSMADAGGEGGETTTAMAEEAANPPPFTFVVPFNDENSFVRSLRSVHNPERGAHWRIPTPDLLENVMRYSKMRHQSAEHPAPPAGPPSSTAAERGEGAGAEGFYLMRNGIFARCQSAIAQHARKVLEAELPSIDPMMQNMLVARTARQLAQWAISNVEPMDLRELSKDRARAANARESPWMASQAERDARLFLEASQGRLEGPLPATNRALRDWMESTRGVGGDVGDHTAKTPGNEFVVRGIVTILIRALMENPHGSGPGAPANPKPVPHIMEHARRLCNQDGIPVMRQAADGAPQIVLLRAANVMRLLGISPQGAAGKGGHAGGHAAEEARQVIEDWRRARQDVRDNPQRLVFAPLASPVEGARQIGEEWSAMRGQLGGGGGGAGPGTGGERVRVGYEATARLSYYRAEVLDRETGRPPLRARIPVKESTRMVFMKQERTNLDIATDWELAFNVLMPTCPMANLLMEGPSPDVMGSHATLDQYIMLLWLALDRTGVPQMRPPVPSLLELLQEEARTPEERAEAERRIHLAFKALRTSRHEEGRLAHLPDWCGDWFLPESHMAPVLDAEELEAVYPQGTPQREILGVTWLRQAQHHRQAILDERGEGAPPLSEEELRAEMRRRLSDLTPTKLIDLFGIACDTMEREAERDRAEARLRRARARRAKDEADPYTREWLRGLEKEEGESMDELYLSDDGDGGGAESDHEGDEWGGDADDPFAKYARECTAAFSEPDRSRAGRAETLMILNAIPAHYENVRQCVEMHNHAIERLRACHGPGVDCGNGYANVRPAAYYEGLWEQMIRYTSHLLYTYELGILLAHSRWLDTDKARAQLLPPGFRLDPATVADAPPVAVRRVLERRERSLRRRMLTDGRSAQLVRGLGQMVNRDGTLVPEGVVVPEPGWWLHQRVPSAAGGARVVRPDAPRYMDMILYDALIDYTPGEHEVGRGAFAEETADMNALADRVLQMKINMAREEEANPDQRLSEYALPLKTTLEAEQEAYRAALSEGQDRQTKRAAARAAPFDDYHQQRHGEAAPAARGEGRSQPKRSRPLEEVMDEALGAGGRLVAQADGTAAVERVRADGTLPANTATSSMTLD